MMRGWLTLALVAVLVVACGGGSVSLDEPPSVRLGEDACDECRMIISEARFAAAYVTEDGTVRRFDDIGDMLVYHVRNQENVAVFWVHDYETEEWVRAEWAFFVQASDISTPMGHGIVAFAERERAEKFAAEHDGRVLTFDEALAVVKGGVEGGSHMQHERGGE